MEFIFGLLSAEQWTALSAVVAIVGTCGSGVRWITSRQRIKRINAQPARHLNRNIIGREADAHAIATAFEPEPGEARQRTVILTGGPGTGKTTLARYYFEQYRERYEDMIFLRSETEPSITADLADFVMEQQGHKAPPSVKLRTEVAQGLLTQLSAKARWLAIIDNAPDQSAVSAYIPSGQRMDVLITSRNPDWRGVGMQVQRPSRLSRDQAVALLTEEAGRDSDRFDALAEALDDLPLALVQAGEWLRGRPGERVDAYLAALDKMLDRRDAASIVDPDYSKTTAAVLRLSYRDLSRDAKALVRVLSGFDPDAIDATAFERLAQVRLRFVVLALMLGGLRWRVWRISRKPDRLRAAFRELELRALLEPGEAEGSLRMHRITGRVIRRLYGERRVNRQLDGLLALVFPGNTIASGVWKECARLLPHCLMSLNRPSWMDDEVQVWGAARMAIASRVFDYVMRIGDVNGALDLSKNMYDAMAMVPEAMKTAKAMALAEFRYGHALEAAGQAKEALPLVQSAIDRLSRKSPNHPQLGAFHSVLA